MLSLLHGLAWLADQAFALKFMENPTNLSKPSKAADGIS
jgi:hypothetical protein